MSNEDRLQQGRHLPELTGRRRRDHHLARRLHGYALRFDNLIITQLQTLIDRFRDEYNHHRPHRSLPHRATPAALYDQMPKALPGPSRDTGTHNRIRHDRVDQFGTVTLRVAGKLRHFGIGRTHSRTHVILLIQDLNVRVVNVVTGELLRELTINQTATTSPETAKIRTPSEGSDLSYLLRDHIGRAGSVLVQDIGNPSLKT
jgi:hypothetical protein